MNGATIALITAAAGFSGSYGNSLLNALHVRHPELSGVQIVAATRDGAQITIERRWRGRSRTSATHALSDANGNEIGTVSLKSSCSRAPSSSDLEAEISRRIYTSESLSEPDPFVTGATRAPAAQLMIDDALSSDPTIITLAFHVTPPGRRRCKPPQPPRPLQWRSRQSTAPPKAGFPPARVAALPGTFAEARRPGAHIP